MRGIGADCSPAHHPNGSHPAGGGPRQCYNCGHPALEEEALGPQLPLQAQEGGGAGEYSTEPERGRPRSPALHVPGSRHTVLGSWGPIGSPAGRMMTAHPQIQTAPNLLCVLLLNGVYTVKTNDLPTAACGHCPHFESVALGVPSKPQEENASTGLLPRTFLNTAVNYVCLDVRRTRLGWSPAHGCITSCLLGQGSGVGAVPTFILASRGILKDKL